MSAPEIREAPLVLTPYGWASASLTPPRDIGLLWAKMPEGHTYTWDGDGWYRIDPPDQFYVSAELGHP